jgi:7-carboxy-7-deazaguanine synthase
VTRATAGSLLVSEVFGPTVQGEGPASGRNALFVRLGMCNLSCSWCDTSYTWDRKRHPLEQLLKAVPVEHILADLLGRRSGLVVLTGGEPLLQRAALVPLARALRQAGRAVHIETSGTVPAGPMAQVVDLFVVSPKLANSGLPASRRIRPEVLRSLFDTGHAVLKFVVTGPRDLEEAAWVVELLGVAPEGVWIMPEGTDAERVLSVARHILPAVLDRGWSLSLRHQVLLWGDERGR